MFTSYPGSKTYFSHIDISSGSPHLLNHGRKIVMAIAEGAQDISQLAVSLEPLQTLHAYRLRIHPSNFKVPVKRQPLLKSQNLSHCMFFTLKVAFNLQQLLSSGSLCLKWFLIIAKVPPCWKKQLFLSLQLFSHCMLVTLACYLGEEFTPVAHAAVDKYLSAFAAVLAEKYR